MPHAVQSERNGSSRADTSLPARLTSFVGRETELEGLACMVRESRLVTITGAAGMGKTRIALEVANRLPRGMFGSVRFVDLAPLTDGSLVPRQLASAAGVGERADEPLVITIARALGTGPALFVLDNCEHLVEATASLAEELLSRCPDLRLIATSRQRLRVSGEVVWRLGPLGLPDAGRPATAEDALRSEAVLLFEARARLLWPDFRVSAANAALVAQVCRRLDGIPLAIELAAARVEVMSLGDILTRLEDRLRLLTGGPSQDVPRHQTLHAALAWGHDLLDARERILFRRLAVFAGGLDLSAAEDVCSGDGLDRQDVVGVLFGLVEKSLLAADASGSGPTRYRLLDTVREFAAARLAESGEIDVLAARHATAYLALAERAAPLERAPDQVEWLERLDADHDNLRAALAWHRQHDPTGWLRLAGALAWFWVTRGHFTEGGDWLRAALAAAPPDDPAHADGLMGLARLSFWRGDYDAAHSLCSRCLLRYRRQGADVPRGWALVLLGSIHAYRGEFAESRRRLEEALRTVPDPHVKMEALVAMGEMLLQAGEVAEARRHLLEVGTLSEGPDAPRGRAALFLGIVSFFCGDRPGTAQQLGRALAIFRHLGNRYAAAGALDACAAVAVSDSEPLFALRLAGAADAMRRSTGAELAPKWREVVEALVTQPAFAAAGDAGRAAWAAGGRLPLDDAIALAIGSLEGPAVPAGPETPHAGGASRRTRPGGLSLREQEVADLVVQGLTNREICERLRISERTVEGHVERIRAKLNVRSRTAVAASIARLRAFPERWPGSPPPPSED